MTATIIMIDRDMGRVLRWVDSAITGDSVRPALMNIRVKAPFIEATDGFAIHRATFENQEWLNMVFEDGLYKLLAIHPGFAVMERISSTESSRNWFPEVESVWRDPEKIRADIDMAAPPEGVTRAKACAQIGLYPRLLARALKVKAGGRSVITFASANLPYHVWVGCIDTKAHGKITLEAVIMPMRIDGVKGISITWDETR